MLRKRIVNEEEGLRAPASARPQLMRQPANKEPAVRFVPLGGLEEIGRNMMFFEYENEIVIIDAGLQFPEEETPGIDFIIPNVSYLEEHKDKIKGLIITHAHLDHIGAIPYIMQKIGNPPIYTTALSKALIQKRQDEFPNAPKLIFMDVKPGDVVKISPNFTAEFFGGMHTIPDAIMVMLRTPVGNMCNLGDFRLEYDINGKELGLEIFQAMKERGVHALFMDSTNADRPGKGISEELVEKNIEELFNQAKGRIIVGTFASLLDRLGAIIRIAERTGRKVAISGRSMKENIRIAQNLGYIQAKPRVLISL